MTDRHLFNVRASTLAEIVQNIARKVRDAPTAQGRGRGAVCDVWRAALNVTTETELFNGLALFRRTLDRLERQVTALAMIQDDTRAFIIESIDGLRTLGRVDKASEGDSPDAG